MPKDASNIAYQCLALQEDELVALESIFPPDQVRIQRCSEQGQSNVISFTIPVALPKETRITIDGTDSSEATSSSLDLLHLPPMSLTASLPESYPLEAPPSIDRLSAPWINTQAQRNWLEQSLQQLWKDLRGEALWTWGDWLREGWVEDALRPSPNAGPFQKAGFLSFHDVDESPSNPRKHDLSQLLQRYDDAARHAAFGKERFLCGICLETQKGSDCFKIDGCAHVFCRSCLTAYLTLHLTEGSLSLAQSCPDPDCISAAQKAKTNAAQSIGAISQEQLSSVLQGDPSLLERLDFLQKKQAAEADPTAIPCPNRLCQTLTGAREEDKAAGGRWEAFRQCSACDMSFCLWCRKTWHAPSPCSVPATSSLIRRYDSAPDAERRVLESRYGRKNLLRLKAACEEEKANQEWLSRSTQPCPHCSSPIEKSSGCNHMVCSHCSSHFCHLCGARLSPSRPYEHFNTPDGPCYQRLFDGLLPSDQQRAGLGEAAGGELDDEARREEEQHLVALAAIQAAFE